MKKIILFAAILLTSFSVVKSQNVNDDVTLNVKLHGLQSLTVNTGQKTVDLVYDDASKYLNGVSSTQLDHLNVSSTGGFTISVQSATSNLTSTGTGGQTILASTIKIKAEQGSTNPLLVSGQTLATVNLSATPENIINSGIGGFDKNFNITYTGLGGNAYMGNYIAGEDPSIYTTTVTYTLTAE